MRNSFLLAICVIISVVSVAYGGSPGISANPSGIAVQSGGGLENPADVLYDNGDWDGVNGYTCSLSPGLDRSLLDDFTVPDGGWDITGASTLYIWNTLPPGSGTDMRVEFYADNTCAPGSVLIASSTTTNYSEVNAAKGEAFGRAIAQIDVTFNTIHLDPGHYWVDLQVVGPQMGFILTASQNDCACWVDYADLGGRAPGFTIFNVDSDIVFGLSGIAGQVEILYDNGWDGIGGYSDILGEGLDRSLLDDFIVPEGGWDISSASTLYIWNTLPPGSGTDMTVEFYADDGLCGPDTVLIASPTTVRYSEVDAGMGEAFGRPIALIEVTFDFVHLEPGHYWIDFQVVGPENGFVLTAAQRDCACWVDYGDFGGRSPGINIFGVDSDVNFRLRGIAGPAYCLTMTVSPLVAGSQALWKVSGATPGSVVSLVLGYQAGSTIFTGEFGYCASFGIEGVDQTRLIASRIAGIAGVVFVKLGIPKYTSGLTVLTQAAEKGTCPDECISEVDTQVIQ